jgi:hypothetical protein
MLIQIKRYILIFLFFNLYTLNSSILTNLLRLSLKRIISNSNIINKAVDYILYTINNDNLKNKYKNYKSKFRLISNFGYQTGQLFFFKKIYLKSSPLFLSSSFIIFDCLFVIKNIICILIKTKKNIDPLNKTDHKNKIAIYLKCIIDISSAITYPSLKFLFLYYIFKNLQLKLNHFFSYKHNSLIIPLISITYCTAKYFTEKIFQ